MDTCLVTGSAGFLGSHIVRLLKSKGFHVIGVDLVHEANSDEFICMDVSDLKLYHRLFDMKLDYVFHFGTPSSAILFEKNSRKCYNDTLISQKMIFKLSEKIRPLRLFFPSSATVYGETSGPARESDRLSPISSYASAKAAAESVALASSFNDWVGLRIFAGYGEGEEKKGNYASIVHHLLDSLIRKKRPVIYGDGTQTRDFVHVNDIVRVIEILIDSDHSGIINVGSGNSVSFNDLLIGVSKSLGQELEEPVFTGSFGSNYLKNLRCDSTLLQDITGVKMTSLGKGIIRFYDYLRDGN